MVRPTADASETGKQTEAIRAFNRSVFEDERVTHCTVPVSDGLTLVRVRAEGYSYAESVRCARGEF